MEKNFQIIAVVLGGVAAFFFWQQRKEVAFVAGVLGCASFFLSVRYAAKERVDEIDSARKKRELIEENLPEESIEEFAEGEKETKETKETNLK